MDAIKGADGQPGGFRRWWLRLSLTLGEKDFAGLKFFGGLIEFQQGYQFTLFGDAAHHFAGFAFTRQFGVRGGWLPPVRYSK